MNAPTNTKRRSVISRNKIEEANDEDVDLELGSPSKFFGSHTNLIPLQSAVAGPRLFYGARFINQAMPIVNREEPLVQTAIDEDPQGRSFDDFYGQHMGAIRADQDGRVRAVKPDHIELENDKGERWKVGVYNNFPMNRKTGITSQAIVKPGDLVKRDQPLTISNFTDKKGTLAMGANARVGLVPYKGYSMDDSVVVSESFAKRLSQQAMYGFDTEYKRGVKGGKSHHIGLFPQKFTKAQLDQLDNEGVATVGTRVKKGDPIILASRPKVISSQQSQLGRLSSHMKNARSDASTLWEEDEDGIITDVKKLPSGARVNVMVDQPTKVGDKMVLRSGQKGVVSLIIPDDHMPRTMDGKSLEVLLNPLGIPSRVNNSLIYELLLGKAASKTGQPYRLPGFNKPEEKWYDFVKGELDKNGLAETEEVFDPKDNRKLENPITVGVGHILKLHHTSGSKFSTRGQGGYDVNEQPAKGGGELAQSKRLSGLEAHALMSAGAYGVLKDMATLRGQKNDEFWRALRSGHEPRNPGVPFAFNKFQALLNGAGFHARKLPEGVERLSFWTDKDLDKVESMEVKSGELVDSNTLEAVPGGLFDDALTGNNRWGHVKLPFRVPNPAAETVVRKLLGLTEKQFRAIMAGEEEMPPHLLMPKNPAQ